MKKAAYRLVSLALMIALCLLPTMAGAIYLDKTELEFIVGEPADKLVQCKLNEGEDGEPNIDIIPNAEEEKYGLKAWKTGRSLVTIKGTPIKEGDYIQRFLVIYGSADPIYLEVHIYIRAKETPVAPAVPTVVDNVIYNAAPEHEQALIRGVREWCNVRAGAGTNSAVIGRANLGQQISLLRWNADESWCFVEFNGLQGWIAKQFILPIK